MKTHLGIKPQGTLSAMEMTGPVQVNKMENHIKRRKKNNEKREIEKKGGEGALSP